MGMREGDGKTEEKRREEAEAKAHYASCLQALCRHSISHIQSVIVPLGRRYGGEGGGSVVGGARLSLSD